MARKQTAIPESALMEAFEQGRLHAWDSAYDAGWAKGFEDGQSSMAFGAEYAQGRAHAAESIARWLDILPDEVFAVLKPHLVHALTVALLDEPPF